MLFAAFVILFGFPGRTEELFAWTMRPDLTPMVIGAGYLGGVWMFTRIIQDCRPHRVVGGLTAATVFTFVLGGATILHWDLFNHSHVSFWAWLVLYTAGPVLLAWLSLRNWREQGEIDGRGARLSSRARGALAVTGGVQLVAAVVLFTAPSVAIDAWPWTLTPLTARTLSAFVAFSSVQLLWSVVDDRWDALQYGIEAVVVGLAGIGVSALRGRRGLTTSTANSIIFVVALIVLLGALVALVLGQRHRHANRA